MKRSVICSGREGKLDGYYFVLYYISISMNRAPIYEGFKGGRKSTNTVTNTTTTTVVHSNPSSGILLPVPIVPVSQPVVFVGGSTVSASYWIFRFVVALIAIGLLVYLFYSGYSYNDVIVTTTSTTTSTK